MTFISHVFGKPKSSFQSLDCNGLEANPQCLQSMPVLIAEMKYVEVKRQREWAPSPLTALELRCFDSGSFSTPLTGKFWMVCKPEAKRRED